MIQGFLDANSSYNIFVTNINFREEDREIVDFFKKHNYLNNGSSYMNRLNGLEGFLS